MNSHDSTSDKAYFSSEELGDEIYRRMVDAANVIKSNPEALQRAIEQAEGTHRLADHAVKDTLVMSAAFFGLAIINVVVAVLVGTPWGISSGLVGIASAGYAGSELSRAFSFHQVRKSIRESIRVLKNGE